jgi:hypothetical protein
MTDVQKDQAAQRKAYGAATQRLREAFRIEFDIFLTEEYEKAGVSVRRRKTAAEAEALKAAKAKERAEKAAEKASEKIAKIEAQLEEAKAKAAAALAAVPVEVEDDPMAVFTEPASA